MGNILSLQHSAGTGSYTRDYNYSSGNSRLNSTDVGATNYPYTYDNRGNMISMPHLSAMQWNPLNELQKTTRGTTDTYFNYSGGERIRKVAEKTGGIKEERIYLGSYEIYRKFVSGSLTIERTTVHISDDTGRIVMLEERTVGSDAAPASLQRYIYSNHLQTASLELDENADIISYEEYHPFGTTAYQASNSAINVLAKRYRYTGKERDEETGLYYHGARYYIPWLAVWTAIDPMEAKYAGLSPYNYSMNNPVMMNDPNGADPQQQLGTAANDGSTSNNKRGGGGSSSGGGGSKGSSGGGDSKGSSGGEKKEEVKNKNVYLDIEGKILGYDENISEDKVFVADSKNEDGTFKNPIDLGITQSKFGGFASLVWNESGGAKDESFAIANAVVNYVKKGGSTAINSLDAVLLKPNYYSRAVKQPLVDRYAEKSAKNPRYEMAAVVNALGRVAAPNDNRFKDNTNGATHWDGVDLVVGVNKNGSLIANSHRSYNWSSDSKDLLTTYYNDYGVSSRNITTEGKNKAGKKIFITNLITNDSVDPSKWSYMNKKFDVSAKAIFGKSLFQLITSPGESNVKGGKNINYKKIKIF